jgi:hypothetical protein
LTAYQDLDVCSSNISCKNFHGKLLLGSRTADKSPGYVTILEEAL